MADHQGLKMASDSKVLISIITYNVQSSCFTPKWTYKVYLTIVQV